MGEFTIADNASSQNKKTKGRFKDIDYDKHLTIEYGDISAKQSRYQQLLTAMLQDQLVWIENRNHVRIIDDTNAVESTRLAEQATLTAHKINLEKV